MDLMVNPVITDFRQDVNGDIKMLKLGANKEDAYANIIEQGGAKLDNNKTATIDVSTYTEPVVINPTSGKDGMKKATVTLSNIPSPSGSATLYAWNFSDETVYTNTSTPQVGDTVFSITQGEQGFLIQDNVGEHGVEGVVEGGILWDSGTPFERASDFDVVIL